MHPLPLGEGGGEGSSRAQHTEQLKIWREKLDCGFPQIANVFEDCMVEAQTALTPEGMEAYLEQGRFLGKMGRGVEPVLIFLQEWPQVARILGESSLPAIMDAIRAMTKSPNGKAIAPFLQSLAAIARRLPSQEQLQHYLDLSLDYMERTSGSIHGIHKTYASPSLPDFFQHSPQLLSLLSIGGLRNWVTYGVRNYSHHPAQQRDYFSLQSADSRAVLQRERHGTLLVDNARCLDLYLRGLWQDGAMLVPYSTAFDELRKPIPYYDALGIRLPDVYDDFVLPLNLGEVAGGVKSPHPSPLPEGEGTRRKHLPEGQSLPLPEGEGTRRKDLPGGHSLPLPLGEGRGEGCGQERIAGIDRYRVALAHMAAHRRWSSAIFADNFSPFQRLAIECFEDARVDTLAMRTYPGLRRMLLTLHPSPVEGACNDQTQSCLRHRLAMLSRALLDAPHAPSHGYRDPDLNDYVQRFHALMATGEASTAEIATVALSYVAKTRRQSDQLASTYFMDTEADYRDDNRHLWIFHELSDDEEMFEEHRPASQDEDVKGLPPRYYPEWDYSSQSYRPDWVSLYERLHPSGYPADIDKLLAKHSVMAKRIKRLLYLLKPQNKVRVRYQEEGSELDLDVALRSFIDFKSGHTPDPRINMSHRTDGRNIAVMLLLDLSESLNEKAAGSDQTILQLSREAVSLLAWAIEQLGDRFAIAGFHSNTRHDVRYLHIKGFGEHWGDEVKARLAAMQAGYSTRMGAAMRHAAHYLQAQTADKKLLLVLTDGEPSDVDVDVADERLLIEDARQCVRELDQQGIFSYCISLDPKADTYVSDIFGRQHTVIDHIDRLPEQLPRLFMALTH